MAEGLLRSKLSDTGIEVSSRGLMVFSQVAANEYAILAMSERGINISKHLSRPFDKDELEDNTLILTMTNRHKIVLTQHGYKGDVYSIKDFVGVKGDVNDPYGGDLNLYRECADELEALIDEIGGKLL
jgi:protein-tyrosine-phosphatase